MIAADRRALPVEDQLILLAVGTAERRRSTRERAERLALVVDWPLLVGLLRRRRLLTLLGPRLESLAPDAVGEQFASEVRGALEAGARHGGFLQLAAERVTGALSDAGIRCAMLKGPALSQMLYGDPGRRPSGDIDVLVAREQLHDAVRVARELGYVAPADHVDGRGLPRLHFTMTHPRGQLPPVELHWRIHWYEERYAGERLLAPGTRPAPDWRAAPIDLLAALLLFYARDGFINLRHATDLGACWDAVGDALPAAALSPTIAGYPALAPALQAAAAVAERDVGLPLERLLAQRRGLGARARLAIRLAAPNPHASLTQLYADMSLIDGLLTPPGGLAAFLRRQVIPPREVLREQSSKEQQRANTRVGHGARVLARYGLSMARLLPAVGRFAPR
jgi:hypothetical protein